MVKFDIYEDLEKVNANSLLIDSGKEVASLQVSNIYLSLMCYGEVNVNYKDKTFKSASDYPQIIIDYFLGKIEDKKLLDELDSELWVGDNNWFQAEIFVITDNKEYRLKSIDRINDYADTFDIEGCLEHYELSKSVMLYNILLGHLKDLKRDYGDEIKELQDLDLSNL